MPDANLVDAIRGVARLRHQGLRASRERVRRLMRENGLSAAARMSFPRGPRSHDGTIFLETVDTMWDDPCRAISPSDNGE